MHIALVLDRSGSMGGRKLDLAKKAVGHAVQLLSFSEGAGAPRDRLAVVCYDEEIETLLGATSASAEAKTLVTSRLAFDDAQATPSPVEG